DRLLDDTLREELRRERRVRRREDIGRRTVRDLRRERVRARERIRVALVDRREDVGERRGGVHGHAGLCARGARGGACGAHERGGDQDGDRPELHGCSSHEVNASSAVDAWSIESAGGKARLNALPPETDDAYERCCASLAAICASPCFSDAVCIPPTAPRYAPSMIDSSCRAVFRIDPSDPNVPLG